MATRHIECQTACNRQVAAAYPVYSEDAVLVRYPRRAEALCHAELEDRRFLSHQLRWPSAMSWPRHGPLCCCLKLVPLPPSLLHLISHPGLSRTFLEHLLERFT